MSSLVAHVILFVVFVTVVVPKNVLGSISTQDIDVDKLLELVQQQRINVDDSSDSSDSSDSDDSDTSSEDIARTGRIEGENLMEIISQIVNNKNNKQVNNNHKNRNERASLERAQKYNNRESKNDNVQRKAVQMLVQLFNKGFKDAEPKWQSYSKTPKKMIPNRLLGGVKNKNADDGLDEYSKIYILLNPQGIQKSKDNKSAVNKMISKILSLSSLPSKRDQVKPKQKRYKGFAIKGDIGRRRGPWENLQPVRKSNSVYAPRDSDLEEKPKRSHGIGGGTSYTAIPYIRHRGENIYERAI